MKLPAAISWPGLELPLAQGIVVESPQEAHRRFPRTWNGKPGRRVAAMRPEASLKICAQNTEDFFEFGVGFEVVEFDFLGA
jgi:hypothetical protein